MGAKVRQMTMEELLALPPSFGIVTAGKAWGLGQEKSYEMAGNGTFPCKVLRLGRQYRVTKAELFRSLGLELDGAPAAEPPIAQAS